jgi:hypothetical protein
VAILITNWRNYVTPLDATIDGKQQPVWVMQGFDAPVYLDISSRLDAGEVLTTVTTTVLQLPAQGEAGFADVSVGIKAAAPSIVDTVVSQRLHGMVAGRVYRLEVTFGAVGNVRGASLLVGCVS